VSVLNQQGDPIELAGVVPSGTVTFTDTDGFYDLSVPLTESCLSLPAIGSLEGDCTTTVDLPGVGFPTNEGDNITLTYNGDTLLAPSSLTLKGVGV